MSFNWWFSPVLPLNLLIYFNILNHDLTNFNLNCWYTAKLCFKVFYNVKGSTPISGTNKRNYFQYEIDAFSVFFIIKKS